MSDLENNLDTGLDKLKKIASFADDATLIYIEDVAKTLSDPNADPVKLALIKNDIGNVLKVAKLTSERILLAEGKNTANIGVNGNGLPFKVTFVETYEGTAPDDTAEDDDASDTAATDDHAESEE